MQLNDAKDLLGALQTAPWETQPLWHFQDTLKYAQEGRQEAGKCNLASCPDRQAQEGLQKGKKLRCAKCGTVYCSKRCQILSWKQGHKLECSTINRLRAGALTQQDERAITELLLRRIRLYLCPMAVSFQTIRGKGYVNLRSNTALEDWLYAGPADSEGRLLQERNVQLLFETFDEFEAKAFEDDFELAVARPKLEEALNGYNPQEQVVVVILLRCGFLSIVTIPIVPDLSICKQLGAMYRYAELEGPLQLNVDAS